MNALGIETSGTVCGVAHLALRPALRAPVSFETALRDGTCILREYASDFSRHSEVIFGLLDRVLREARSRIERVNVIAVSLGPGSFTGLRIGLALAKTLARFGRIPLAGIPTLEALAAEACLSHDAPAYAPLMDARRGEVYASLYRPAAGGMVRVRGPWVAGRDAVMRALPAGARVAEGQPRATTIAALGALRFRAGWLDDPGRLVPVYVRRPEAVEKLRRGLRKP
jgi:tRNA threonylcarbamoyladenosine biosynthesis protein TsaB